MNSKLSIRFLDGPGGTRVAYTVRGEGPLLLCPAWWVSHLEEDWKEELFRAFFTRLAAGRTVVRYDRPGAGLSAGGAVGRPEGGALDAEVSVLESVLDELGAERAALFAVSCGGPPAVAFAARHPQRVERLALFGSYTAGCDLAGPDVLEAVCGLVRAHWGMGSEALAAIFHPGLSAPALRRLARRLRAAADADLACRLLRLTHELDASREVGRVRCPTLVIHRRGDRAVPVEAGRRLAAALQDASFVSLEGAAHLPWEGEDDVVPLLAPFFGVAASPGSRVSPPEEPDDARPSFYFDRANREVAVEGERCPLTPLEHGLLSYLVDRANRVVTRDEALRDVWSKPFGGSNMVDAVVLTLRRKLGPYADRIETVTGHGYRFRSAAPEEWA